MPSRSQASILLRSVGRTVRSAVAAVTAGDGLGPVDQNGPAGAIGHRADRRCQSGGGPLTPCPGGSGISVPYEAPHRTDLALETGAAFVPSLRPVEMRGADLGEPAPAGRALHQVGSSADAARTSRGARQDWFRCAQQSLMDLLARQDRRHLDRPLANALLRRLHGNAPGLRAKRPRLPPGGIDAPRAGRPAQTPRNAGGLFSALATRPSA